MRLIDADKLENEYNQYNYYLTYSDCLEELRKAPLVKAIPVEWISKYSRKPISNTDYWAIMRMVTEWEKENEIY